MPTVVLDRKELRQQISDCTSCDIAKLDNCGPVLFTGNPSSNMVVGEAPGRTEDEKGKPFLGPAGKLLWEELGKLGMTRADFFVTNAVSCYPNRPEKKPTEGEIYACRGHLYRQVKYCDPVAILALGATANESFGKKEPMGKIHGKWYRLPWFKTSDCADIYVFPTWHPSYLLRDLSRLRAWREDLNRFVNEDPPR